MRAGRRRHPVVIEKLPDQPQSDDHNVQQESWQELARLWADVSPLRGREFFAAQEIQAAVQFRIRTPFIDGVTPKMRVRGLGHLAGRIFRIHAALNPDERRSELELMCEETV